MEQPYLISQFKLTNRIVSFVSLLLMYVFCFLLLSAYEAKNPTTLSFLLGGISLFLLTTYFLVLLIKVLKVTFYSNRIEVAQMLGSYKKTIALTHIDSWVLRKKKSKYGDYEILYIVLSDHSHLKFRSYAYNNFHLILNKLKNNKPQNKFLRDQLDRKEQNQFTFFFIAIGIIFMGYALAAFQEKEISRTDISIVKGHLSENIAIKKSKNSSTLIITLDEHPEYEFKIGSFILQETASGNLMTTYQKGDELQFAIEKEAYEKKITKTQNLSAWDLMFHYHSIPIVEVAEDDFVYLSLENYNKACYNNNLGIILFFGAVGVFFTAFGFVRLRKKTFNAFKEKKELPKERK